MGITGICRIGQDVPSVGWMSGLTLRVVGGSRTAPTCVLGRFQRGGDMTSQCRATDRPWASFLTDFLCVGVNYRRALTVRMPRRWHP